MDKETPSSPSIEEIGDSLELYCPYTGAKQKAEIETRIEQFVKSKTNKSIYLDIQFPGKVFIRERNYHAAPELATFWMRILEHSFRRKIWKGTYTIRNNKTFLNLDKGINLTVFMNNGVLMVTGEDVLQWLLNEFPIVLWSYESPVESKCVRKICESSRKKYVQY